MKTLLTMMIAVVLIYFYLAHEDAVRQQQYLEQVDRDIAARQAQRETQEHQDEMTERHSRAIQDAISDAALDQELNAYIMRH